MTFSDVQLEHMSRLLEAHCSGSPPELTLAWAIVGAAEALRQLRMERDLAREKYIERLKLEISGMEAERKKLWDEVLELRGSINLLEFHA